MAEHPVRHCREDVSPALLDSEGINTLGSAAGDPEVTEAWYSLPHCFPS